ncbi:MAG: LPS export ABC transporter periplasmic protein LptC [Bacteroidota bacterium]
MMKQSFYTRAGHRKKKKFILKERSLFHQLKLAAHGLWLVAFLMSCENSEKRIKELTEKVNLKDEAINVESFLSQDGKMKAKLTAPLMLRSTRDSLYVEFPNTLHVDFYGDSSNNIETVLDSRYGKYFENLGKVYLRDSVVVVTIHGDTLKSPDLWWDQNSKIFYTDKFATYRGIGKSIYGGKGLVATQDLNSVIFNDPIGTVQVSESGFPDK